MATTITTSRDGNSFTITVVIQIPSPAFVPPSFKVSFPPTLPKIKLPTLPPALAYLAATIEEIVVIVNKLVAMIPEATVNLKVKLGDATVIDISVP